MQHADVRKPGKAVQALTLALKAPRFQSMIAKRINSGFNLNPLFFGLSLHPLQPGGGMWVAPADRRTMSDQKPYSAGIEAVKRVSPVEYTYSGPGADHHGKRAEVQVEHIRLTVFVYNVPVCAIEGGGGAG